MAINQCGCEVTSLRKTAEKKPECGILEAIERLSLTRHPINDILMVDRPETDNKNESTSWLQSFECAFSEAYFDMTIASGCNSDVKSPAQKLACPISMVDFSPPNAKTESMACLPPSDHPTAQFECLQRQEIPHCRSISTNTSRNSGRRFN
jgi:hypothetical protein